MNQNSKLNKLLATCFCFNAKFLEHVKLNLVHSSHSAVFTGQQFRQLLDTWRTVNSGSEDVKSSLFSLQWLGNNKCRTFCKVFADRPQI